MTNPENPSNWSDPTYQPPPVQQPYPSAPSEAGYPYGDPSTYPTTTPSYTPTPYYAPQPGYAPGMAYGQPPYVVARPPTNGLAIAAMVCALAGLATAISFPVGAILGHIALRQLRERGEEGEGFAKTGIIVGWIGTGLYVLCCGAYLIFFASLFSAGAFSTPPS